MNLDQLSIPKILKQYDLRPKKGLGQNFLSDPNILNKIVEMGGVTAADTVLEIGPGLGSLTRHLAANAKRVVTVEIDDRMLPPLNAILEPFDNIEIVQGDILEIKIDDLFHESGYLVVANIPYYITSAIVRHLLNAESVPARIVLTVQKEVAQRICAQPGELSLLALSVQVYGDVEAVGKIPAAAFYPAPTVDSAVVRIDLFDEPVIPREHLDVFFRLIKAGFSQKRKNLRNTLAAGMHWEKADSERVLAQAEIIDTRRAQTLTLVEWGKLVEVVVADELTAI